MSNSAIAEIEKKISNFEENINNEKNILKNRIKFYVINEEKLKDEIKNLNFQINTLKNENFNLYNEYKIIKENYFKIKNEFDILYNNYINIKEKNENLNVENNKLSNDNKTNINNIENIHNIMKEKDDKITKLNLLLEKYSNDYSNINEQFKIIKEQNDNYLDNNNNYLIKLTKNEKEITFLETENNKLKNENLAFKENYNNIIKKYSDLYSNYNNIENEKNELEKKIINLQFLLEKNNNEINNLKNIEIHFNNFKESSIKNNFNNNNEILKLKNNLNNFSNSSNEIINNFVYWIENYLIKFFEDNIIIPEIIINDDNNLINFNKLKECLKNAKKILDENQQNQINLNKDLKNKLNISVDKNNKLNKNFEDLYKFIIEEIEREKYFVINEFKIDNGDYFKDIIDLIQRVFDILKKIKFASKNDQILCILKENEIFSKINAELKEKNNLLIQDNITLNKRNNLLMKELNSFKDFNNNNFNSNGNNNNYNTEETKTDIDEYKKAKIGQLEENNTKLIKDNVYLIKKVKQLSQRVSNLETVSNNN